MARHVEGVAARAPGIGFRTSRTVVRPFCDADVPFAHPVFADPEVMRYTVGEPDADEAATRERIARYEAIQAEHGFSKWAVWDRASGAYLGDAGLTVLPGTREVELGYRLARAHWGCGLATELAGAWIRHALKELGLPRIIAFAAHENPASIRVMRKVGMTLHREDRLFGMDCVVYETVRR